MNKEEILAKSRAENKNKDVYELEVLKQADSFGIIVMVILAIIFFCVQIFVGGGQNWGMWALVLSPYVARFWVKYIKQRRKYDLLMAIAYTGLVAVGSGYHIYNLIASSTIL